MIDANKKNVTCTYGIHYGYLKHYLHKLCDTFKKPDITQFLSIVKIKVSYDVFYMYMQVSDLRISMVFSYV